MLEMIKQQVVLINKNNRRIGVMEKIKAHREGLLHRAFSIFIFNSKGELLIQQRAMTKYHSGSLWSNTVCSHPKPDETYNQAVHRRLKEEMGFDCKLRKIFCFIYNTGFKNGLIENEYDCVFMGRFDGKPRINPQEIMDWRWIPVKELKEDMILHPDKYSFWLKIALDKINHSQIYDMIK
jgi:isopentenyl-diphosphate Delta-isomerase